MQRKYLVGISDSRFEEQKFKVIEVPNNEEAIREFVRRYGISEGLFLEHVYSKSINSSFAEIFWLDTDDEEERFNETGEITVDEDEFKRRVRAAFGEHSDFANLYIDYYFSDEAESTNGKRTLFPEEMLIYMWLNFPWSGATAFEMTELEVK